MLLEGTVALVTGAGQGVGQGIALALAAEGARVAVTGRTLEKLEEVTDESFAAGWESGPLATFRVMKHCRPHLRGEGCIINLASSAGLRWDMTGYGAYAATKEAIRLLTRAAVCEWGAKGIRTNVILPHAKSPGLQWWMENCPEEAEAFVATIPQRRVGECEEDIGRFVALLCSDASGYVNGQSIALDGGQARLG